MQVKKKIKEYLLPTLFLGSSPTNSSSRGGEGEGPRNEVASSFLRQEYDIKRSVQNIETWSYIFLTLLKISLNGIKESFFEFFYSLNMICRRERLFGFLNRASDNP